MTKPFIGNPEAAPGAAPTPQEGSGSDVVTTPGGGAPEQPEEDPNAGLPGDGDEKGGSNTLMLLALAGLALWLFKKK